MSIINVKVAHIRPEYQNLKEWMKNPDNIYIGRAGPVFINNERFPKKSSLWANPYKIGIDGSREKIIYKYDKYIRKLLKDKNIQKELFKLKDKNLGCWCHPDTCHGDVLLKLISEYCDGKIICRMNGTQKI